jgi:hypothetical protein
MTILKKALIDLEIVAGELAYNQNALLLFQHDNQYTRGGSYPKAIMALKTDIAGSIIRLHKRLLSLGLTEQAIRPVKISRNRYAYCSDTGGIAIATKAGVLDVQRS